MIAKGTLIFLNVTAYQKANEMSILGQNKIGIISTMLVAELRKFQINLFFLMQNFIAKLYASNLDNYTAGFQLMNTTC